MTTAAARPAATAPIGLARQQASIRRLTVLGLATVVLFAGSFGLWGATVPLAGAVVAGGQVVVDGNVKTIQHPHGGVIAEIRVRDGMAVSDGELLIRLDDTIPRANLQVIVKLLGELDARQARLEAERDGKIALALPAALAARADDPDVARAIASETSLFTARLAARDGQQQQLKERIAQSREEIAGLAAQETARRQQVDLIQRELVDVRALFQRNLVPQPRLFQLEREAARLAGEIGQLIAERARAKGRIAETELQILQIGQDLQREVAAELRDVQARIGEAVEKRVTAEDVLMRTAIRAPRAGLVHQLAYHTIGGVVQTGQPVLQIVPGDDRLVVEVRIAPGEVDRVAVGQAAVLRFTSFPHGSTPELAGSVTRVSADIVREPQAGSRETATTPYFLARVAADDGELAKLAPHHIQAGMPVEVFVTTGERTALAYLIKPITDRIKHAFRER